MKKGDKIYCHSALDYTTFTGGKPGDVDIVLTSGNFYIIQALKKIYGETEYYCEISTNAGAYSIVFKDRKEFSMHCYTLNKYRRKKLERLNSL